MNREEKLKKAQTILKWRKEMGVTQQCFANIINYKQENFSRLENYGMGLREEHFIKIEALYKSWVESEIFHLLQRIEFLKNSTKTPQP